MRRRTTLALILGIAAPIAATGCASLDPSEEIALTAGAVESRTELEPAWDAPWDEPSAAWDGRAPLSSDAAVLAALQNNRRIRQQVESIVGSRADYVQAHLLPNPVVSVMLGFPIDGGGGSPMAISLVQQLSWLWQRPTRIDAADAELRRSALAVTHDVLELVATVRTTHARVAFAERAVELQDSNCELIEQVSDLIGRQLDVGEATQLDVNRVSLDLLQAKAELVDRKATLARLKRELLELLGRADATTDWRTTGPTDLAMGNAPLPREEALMRLASRQRLDVAAAQSQQLAAKHNVELARLGRLPDVSGGARYEENLAGREAIGPTVSASIPVFDDNRARIAKAASMLRQAEMEADRVLQQAQREVRTAFIEASSTRAVVSDYQKRIVELADENADLAERAFTAGTTDLTVLLESQRRQTTARTRLNDLRARYAASHHELERAAGGSLSAEVLAALEQGEPLPTRFFEDEPTQEGPSS